jgi:tetratricopeptide (TPR) repeat protein
LALAPFCDLKLLLIRRGRFAEAADTLWSQIEACVKRGTMDRFDLELNLIEIGHLSRRAGRLDEAEDAHARAIAIAEEIAPTPGVALAIAQKALAETLLARGRREEATSLLQQVEKILAAIHGPEHAEVVEVRQLMQKASTG